MYKKVTKTLSDLDFYLFTMCPLGVCASKRIFFGEKSGFSEPIVCKNSSVHKVRDIALTL